MAVYQYMNFDIMGLINQGINLWNNAKRMQGLIPPGLKSAIEGDNPEWLQKAKGIAGGVVNKVKEWGGNLINKFTGGGQQPATAPDGTVTSQSQAQASQPTTQQTAQDGTVTTPPPAQPQPQAQQPTTPAPQPQVQTQRPSAPKPPTQPKPPAPPKAPTQNRQPQNQSFGAPKKDYSTVTRLASNVATGSQQAIMKAHQMFPETRGMNDPQRLSATLKAKANAMRQA